MKYNNIFILCTGRSGSSSFIQACTHITNYTNGHESLATKFGNSRLAYPIHHIEADNRLTWFLGALGDKFDDNSTLYIHLIREKEVTVKSFNNRWNLPGSIIKAFSEGILKMPYQKLTSSDQEQVCSDYYDTVNANIAYFIKNKPNTLTLPFEDIKNGFKTFWKNIDAEGDFNHAMEEFNVLHNKSTKNQNTSIRYRLKLFLLKFR